MIIFSHFRNPILNSRDPNRVSKASLKKHVFVYHLEKPQLLYLVFSKKDKKIFFMSILQEWPNRECSNLCMWLFELSKNWYICFIFFISIAKCTNVVKSYCDSLHAVHFASSSNKYYDVTEA